ncbi:hypothetical protein NE237_016312 [Protea cynaroides]|uniref:TIR domain-containing protein n=1 Tax=Protea cynaroides TaxID=273540 RepID=A0A9Q0JS08_9MAGN|nr:hypothetical protein NE237_016312 [Protea cynaroides]
MAAHDGPSQVYISFSEDTRNNFTSFLVRALEIEGFDVFIHDENLWIGEAILPSLFRIIRSSKISILVISEGYVDSQWCLQEMAEIVKRYQSKCQIVLPVLFYVNTTDFYCQTGFVAESFKNHEKRIDDQTLQEWKDALRVVAGIRRYNLYSPPVFQDQAKLVDLIVEEALIKSSSFHSNDGCAEVFTNYQRKDTVNNFSGFLRSALGKRRIDAFINSENLARGEMFSNHFGIIQSSKISICIISKGYADNRWCLIELAGMVEGYKANCQIILPVFLDVDPKDANYQTGILEASFKKHKNDEIDGRTLKIWKYALTVVGGISGFHLKDVNGNQAQLVNLVVQQAFIESSKFRAKYKRGRLHISTKGLDIRNNFTGFLRIALEREGFDVYRKNEFIWMREAIPSCKILIAVICKGYVDSQFSLMELADMVECYESKGQIILPIFFDVELEDVRNQTGILKASFNKYKPYNDEQTLQTWKNALTVVAGIGGYQLKDVNG